MIAGLQGTVEGRGPDWVIVRVGGVSFQVYAPTSTLAGLGPGEQVRLHTHLHVREDNVALYGFASAEELGLFQMLIGVSGVGPKTALALLSAMEPEQLSLAIATGNAELLSQVPGIGKKTAGRLILELKGKLEAGLVGVAVSPATEANADVVAALTALGYSAREAAAAIATLPDSAQMSLEERVKLALQGFASAGR